MHHLINDMLRFHEMMGIPSPAKPTPLAPARQKLRMKLSEEEHTEQHEALESNHLGAILQENLDVIIVALGNLLEAGLSNVASEAWQLMMESQFSKVDPTTGKVIRRADGKILKPEGWKGVDWNALVKSYDPLEEG